MGDIFPEKEQLIRYSNQDFIGPLSSKTVLNGSNYVIDAKRLEISAVEMKCPYKAYWWLISAKLIYVLSSFHMLFCAFYIHIRVKLIKFPLNLVL